MSGIVLRSDFFLRLRNKSKACNPCFSSICAPNNLKFQRFHSKAKLTLVGGILSGKLHPLSCRNLRIETGQKREGKATCRDWLSICCKVLHLFRLCLFHDSPCIRVTLSFSLYLFLSSKLNEQSNITSGTIPSAHRTRWMAASDGFVVWLLT